MPLRKRRRYLLAPSYNLIVHSVFLYCLRLSCLYYYDFNCRTFCEFCSLLPFHYYHVLNIILSHRLNEILFNCGCRHVQYQRGPRSYSHSHRMVSWGLSLGESSFFLSVRSISILVLTELSRYIVNISLDLT